MRVISLFSLKEPRLPKDYSPVFVSFVKKVLSTKAPELYKELYCSGTTMKKMTFSLKLNSPDFSGDDVKLGGTDVMMSVSSEDAPFSIDLYNSIITLCGLEFPLPSGNSMKVKSVRIENSRRIESESVLVRFLSPLVLRKHSAGLRDRYYVYDDEEFGDVFFDVIANELASLCGMEISRTSLSLVPVSPRKTVSRIFGRSIRCSLGVYRLEGDRAVLNSLYQNGIGSRRSQGCGMFEIVGEVKDER